MNTPSFLVWAKILMPQCLYILAFCALLGLMQCQQAETPQPTSEAKLRFEFRFDKEQQRLNNLAQPATIPAGNAAQTPIFNAMSVHYIEFAPSALTRLGDGQILYFNEEVPSNRHGFTSAIDFSKAIVSPEGRVFWEIPIKDIRAGRYEWVRASVSYQNYEIKFNLKNVQAAGQTFDLNNQKGTIASFLGYNTHLTTHTIKTQTIAINEHKKQGFWAFEPEIYIPQYNLTINQVSTGEAAATTVVNPLAATSPVPAGSCVITGSFEQPLVIRGDETQDVTVVLSFSIQDSFEWQDTNRNGEWDIDVANGRVERVVDMGLRGLQVKVK
jgi:hypothetical protein